MPPKKETAAKKTTSAAKKTASTAAKKATTTAKKAQAQMTDTIHHVEENTGNIANNTKLIHILYILIIILIAIVAGLAFFVGKSLWNGWGGTANATGKGIDILVIDDTRCTTCQTNEIVDQLKSLPFLADAEIEQKDFVDDNMEDYMKKNELTSIPAVIFSSNNMVDGGQIVPYLTPLSSGKGYSLALPTTFDPFAQYSENGYLVLEPSTVASLEWDGALTYGNPDAPITWVEYSDMECPFCAKLHNDGTPDEISEKFGDDINFVFKHFPLDFHPNAQKAAEALECMNEQNPAVVHDIIKASYTQYGNNNFDYDGFVQIAADNGIDTTALASCVDAGTYTQKVLDQMQQGQDLFGITGTPGNVLINNATGEYVVISGAYPADTFIPEIEKMLGESSQTPETPEETEVDETGAVTNPPAVVVEPTPDQIPEPTDEEATSEETQ